MDVVAVTIMPSIELYVVVGTYHSLKQKNGTVNRYDYNNSASNGEKNIRKV